MPTIDYSKLIESYMENEPSTADGFVLRLNKYRSELTQWRSMLCYTLWRMVSKNVIRIGEARDFVNMNMAEILGHYSNNGDYIKALAGIVDIILGDMFQMFHAEMPYLYVEGSSPISPEEVIFNPNALTNSYTFKGFYNDTKKWEEQGVKSFDEAYEIRQVLLNMFLTKTRAEIKSYIDAIRAEIVVEENGGTEPVTVIAVEMAVDEAHTNIVTLELDSKAFAWLNGVLSKKFAVSLYSVKTGVNEE